MCLFLHLHLSSGSLLKSRWKCHLIRLLLFCLINYLQFINWRICLIPWQMILSLLMFFFSLIIWVIFSYLTLFLRFIHLIFCLKVIKKNFFFLLFLIYNLFFVKLILFKQLRTNLLISIIFLNLYRIWILLNYIWYILILHF